MSKVNALKKELAILQENLSYKKLSAEQKQITIEAIAAKKREIEKVSKQEKKLVSAVNAPTINNRKKKTNATRLGSNKFYL